MKLRAACRTATTFVLVASAALAGSGHAWWTAGALTLAASVVHWVGRVGVRALQGAARDQDIETAAKMLLDRLARARSARAELKAGIRGARHVRASALPPAKARGFLTPWLMTIRPDGEARWFIFFRDELPDELWRRLAHEVTALRDVGVR